MSDHSRKELDRHFAWFESKAAAGPAKFVGWLRKPSSILVRIPLAILLIARRHFQLFAGARTLDAAARTRFVRAGCAGSAKTDGELLGWIERKWIERQLVKAERERVKNAQ